MDLLELDGEELKVVGIAGEVVKTRNLLEKTKSES